MSNYFPQEIGQHATFTHGHSVLHFIIF